MKLDTLYSLRKNFTVIGLTGRIGSGCSEIAKTLSDKNFVDKIDIAEWRLNMDSPEDIKSKICYDYLKFPGNFLAYEIIEYKSVVLLHLLHESLIKIGSNASIDVVIKEIINIIGQNGKTGKFGDIFTNRFDINDDYSSLNQFLKDDTRWFDHLLKIDLDLSLNAYLKTERGKILYDLYFKLFKPFSDQFFNILFHLNATKRSRLLHDLGNNLRCYGIVRNQGTTNIDTKNIYTVAETINSIIKIWKRNNSHNGKTKIVIDSLKNSLELMYFKEKYSAFYILSTNKNEENRLDSLSQKTKLAKNDVHFKEILKLDESEYSGSSFTRGEFGYPDIENCIQKSEFHLSLDNEIFPIARQIIKLLALIQQPGIITPSSVERCMQIAFNSKLNSGCISRQVGAVVTDRNFSVKAIGWNDVPEKQLPCNLRNIQDLINDEVNNPNHFSLYERTGTVSINKNSSLKFKELVKSDFSNFHEESLEGRNCSFCFKSHQNTYEFEKNQVHTRSLHAEENAMMQIVKYGGEPLLGGNLFTTASPCELCSKKAFQLGVKYIYYIDPYPGIATQHILQNGIDKENNPILRQFYGAVGRTYQKLYDPFMAYKDELLLLTGISPKVPEQLKAKKVADVLLSKVTDDSVKNKVKEILNEDNSLEIIVDLITKSLNRNDH